MDGKTEVHTFPLSRINRLNALGDLREENRLEEEGWSPLWNMCKIWGKGKENNREIFSQLTYNQICGNLCSMLMNFQGVLGHDYL